MPARPAGRLRLRGNGSVLRLRTLLRLLAGRRGEEAPVPRPRDAPWSGADPQARCRARVLRKADVRRRAAGQRGNSEDPIRKSSTARAHWRPSRIAQTTSDCPRRMSPATKTFGAEVA